LNTYNPLNMDDYQKMKEGFEAYLKSKQYTTKGIKGRLYAFDLFCRWAHAENLDIEQVRYQDLLLFMKHCQDQGTSQRTIQSYMGTVRHFYNHLLKEGIITINPATDIKIRGVKRRIVYHILPPQELHKLYHLFPSETLQERRNKVMLGLLIYQGLKTEELGRIELNHLKLKTGEIDIVGSVNSNERTLQLQPYQYMDLNNYVSTVRPSLIEITPRKKQLTPINPNLVFIGEGGQLFHVKNLMTEVMRVVRSINPKIRNAQQIRASVITKWLKQHNLREVQYLAGHRFISSTEAYQQNDLEGLKEEVDQYHPL